MTYDEAKTLMPEATHLYVGVTALEAVNCPVNKYLTEKDGVTILGTSVPYEAIAAKEIVAPNI